jgi:signal transduction histidine kinase
VVRPLRELGLRAKRLGEGDFDAVSEPVNGVTEIEDLRVSLSGMAVQLQGQQVALHAYLGAVTRAQEEERARLGRELHDETVQALIALGHKAQMVQRSFERSSSQTAEHIATLRQMIQQTIDEIRRLSHGLRPHYLEDLGLVAGLGALAQETGAHISVSGMPRPLPSDQELAVYRIAQEAVNNARHHARASSVDIDLEFTPTTLLLCVCDDGIGFIVPEHMDEMTRNGHFGLMGMRERAQLAGGTLNVVSASQRGTTIEFALPLERSGRRVGVDAATPGGSQ